jgi:hypothetical protein
MSRNPTTQMPLRLPMSLHKTLKAAAAQEGVSLNQYCLYLLSRYTKTPPSQDQKHGETLLQFLEEAQLLQKEMRANLSSPSTQTDTQETPLSRWKRLHEKP